MGSPLGIGIGISLGIPLLALLVDGSGLAAAEGEAPKEPEKEKLSNVRFGFESYGDSYELGLSSPLGSGRNKQHWDGNQAYFLGWYGRIPFLTVGLAATYHATDDRLPGLSLHQKLYGGRIEGGLSFPLLGPLLRIEIMPYAGIASGDLEIGSPFGDSSAHDTVYEYGIHGDAITRIGPVQGGLGIGWARSDADYDEALPGGRTRVELEQSVFVWRAMLGFVF